MRCLVISLMFCAGCLSIEIRNTCSGLGAYNLQLISTLRRRVWPCKTTLVVSINVMNNIGIWTTTIEEGKY